MKWQPELRIPIYHPGLNEESHFYVSPRRNDESILLALFFHCPPWVTGNLSAAEVIFIWLQVINETHLRVVYPKRARTSCVTSIEIVFTMY